MDKQSVLRSKLQLVGVTCMFIAAKFEEIFPPQVRDIVAYCDRAYTVEDILNMEGKILSTLQFNIHNTSPYRFLERFTHLLGVDQKHQTLARYLTEASLLDYRMLKYRPSQIAGAALYLTERLLGEKEVEIKSLCEFSCVEEQGLREGAKDLLIAVKMSERNELNALRKKFSSPKMLGVAKLCVEKLR
jgi:cyclin B